MARNEKLRLYNLFESGLSDISGTISSNYVDIYEIVASNMSGGAMYFQIFDTGSVPTDGDIPRRSYKVGSESVLSISYREGREYHTGAVYSWSSTYDQLTGGTFESASVDVEYKP